MRRDAVYPQETALVFLELLTLSHADWGEPLRIVNGMESVTSRGDEFLPFPFLLEWGARHQDAPPQPRVTIDNVTREIWQDIRQINSPPTALIELVLSDDPDVVEMQLHGLFLRDVVADAVSISGELVLENMAREPYPAGTFSPAAFPGLLR